MAELKYDTRFDTINYLMEYSGEYLVTSYKEIKLEARSLYYSTCRHFGINNPIDISVYFFRMKANTGVHWCGVAQNFWQDNPLKINKIIIGINLPVFKLNRTAIFLDTIPHEVAHAIVANLWPELIKNPAEHHGENWKRIAKFLKANPVDSINLGYSTFQASLNYPEL